MQDQINSWSLRQRELYKFNSEDINSATNCYVAWIDLMGAGHLMSTSIQKSANFLARLHMVSESSKYDSGFDGQTIAINDGIYLISPSRQRIEMVLVLMLARLSGLFLATPRPQDRLLARAGLAYGPVYDSKHLCKGTGVRKIKRFPMIYANVAFGPPIIQAYQSESNAPPYGVAVHESARSFSEPGSLPFRMTHWLWWQASPETIKAGGLPGLSTLKDELRSALCNHFDWMRTTQIFHGLPDGKVEKWKAQVQQYFSLA